MRITGGSLKGRRIKVPQGKIRPAMDRMRESLFAVLGDLTGLSFLDLFSGSGIIALEAASRGAAYIEAVELDPIKRKTLLENLAISPQRIICKFMPVELYVRRAKRCFDMIFCDPPYSYHYKWELIDAITQSPLVKDKSLLMLHRPKEDEKMEDWGLEIVKENYREYGRSVVDFFRLNKT